MNEPYSQPAAQPEPTRPQPEATGQPTLPQTPVRPPAGSNAPPPPPPGPQSGPAGRDLTRERATVSTRTILVLAGIAALAIAALIALAVQGQLGAFLQIGVVFLPLAALAAFAYGGTRNLVSMVFAYIMLAIVVIGLAVNSIIYVLLGYVRDSAAFNRMLAQPGSLNRFDLADVFDPNVGIGLLAGAGLLFLCVLVSASMLLRPVRLAVSRVMPIDPDNFVHKIALATLTMILLSSFVPLVVLMGRPPLLNVISGDSEAGGAVTVGPEDLIYQFVWMIPATLVAAGWPVARRMRLTLERLGFVRPTLKQVAFGVVFGVLLGFAAMYLLDPGINWLWRALGLPTTDVAAFEKLLANLITPLGALLIGVTAGVGEEMAVRGLLQPRIGLIASNLVFTSLHAFQYGLDGLLSVFIIGLILGVIRARTNTTTSAIVHGVYDFTLVLWSVILRQGGI